MNNKYPTIDKNRRRLEELTQLKVGWLTDNNPAPTMVAINKLHQLVEVIKQKTNIPQPYIYPLENGGVTGEWDKDKWMVSVLVEPDGAKVTLEALNIETKQEIELSLKSGQKPISGQLEGVNQPVYPSEPLIKI